MDHVDGIFVSLARNKSSQIPIIACLYTGTQLPTSCEPMLRSPPPAVGAELDNAFLENFEAAISRNPSIHDGAIMIGRRSARDKYAIRGWSYRLFPPPLQSKATPNRGSAFNSCLAMSAVRRVDRIFLLSKGGLIKFASGKYKIISNG